MAEHNSSLNESQKTPDQSVHEQEAEPEPSVNVIEEDSDDVGDEDDYAYRGPGRRGARRKGLLKDERKIEFP